jgi:hypothetical protein
MAMPVLHNQWNLAADLRNLPNRLFDNRAVSIATRVAIAAPLVKLGLELAKWGINQVCPERELRNRCILDADGAAL